MRLGWIRLRWPTSATVSALSRRTGAASPPRPLTQPRPSLAALSSYSRAMLVCNIGLPGADELVQAARVLRLGQLLAQLPVGEHLGQLGQNLQVLLGSLLRYQQDEQQVDRLAVGGVKRHRGGKAHESRHRLAQALDAAVWNGHPLAQAGRAQALAREQAVEYQAARDPLVILENQTGLFEHALLAADVEVEDDVRGR